MDKKEEEKTVPCYWTTPVSVLHRELGFLTDARIRERERERLQSGVDANTAESHGSSVVSGHPHAVWDNTPGIVIRVLLSLSTKSSLCQYTGSDFSCCSSATVVHLCPSPNHGVLLFPCVFCKVSAAPYAPRFSLISTTQLPLSPRLCDSVSVFLSL